MLNVLTPTGARPEAFARCVEYMAAQTYAGPVRWIIVDDGPEPIRTPRIRDWICTRIRPAPLWQPGENTQARNLLAGLPWVDGPLAIVEDDDAYAPWWLERVSEWLETHDLVGEAPSHYRHLNGAEKIMGNTTHASLCATAMRDGAIDAFRQVLTEHKTMIDVELWKRGGKLYPWAGGVIGIKGYPGRPGIGVGHRLSNRA